MPTLFVSHGAPTLLTEDGPAHRFLRGLGAGLPRPEAILVVSAHWATPALAIDVAAPPRTIHDFSGFPSELYRVDYRAPGDPGVIERARLLLANAGFECTAVARGLDHGAWVPLALAWPGADVPVVQLSLRHGDGARTHLAVGAALAALRDERVLVLGSGGATHNLGQLSSGKPPAWALEFDDWLVATIAAGDTEAIAEYRQRAPAAARNHPTEEHFLPLAFAMGAASEDSRGRALHRSFTFGSLAMTAFQFG